MRGVLPFAHERMRRFLIARGARSAFAQVGRSRVHYFDMPGRSDAPPMLLVHGLGAAAADWWRCLDTLADHARRVVAFDLPGFGFSPPPDGGPLGLKELETFFPRFFDQVVGEQAVIVGNSMGGAVTARFTARRPESVAAAVLVAPAGARMAHGRMLDVLRLYSTATARAARELTRRLFHRPPRVLPYLLAADVRQMLAGPCVAQILREALEVEPLTPAELSAIKPPVMLIWGRSERILPYENIHYFRRHLPEHAEIAEVDEFGHCPQLERPVELCRHILGFLERAVEGGLEAGDRGLGAPGS